ncbi:MAG: monofunctional biosynthetic peptidoglycan transglycosylase [Alphaproteobacteria bacterium]|nr:monofunctional biosynthetic peptidoglycan transglycosylase [Alphaproteobacteria bacterium]
MKPVLGLWRVLFSGAVAVVGTVLAVIVAYRVVDPPVTPLMLIRKSEGATLKHRNVPLEKIAPSLPRAAIAAEDNRFCQHHGIDFDAVQDAIEEREETGRVRGASTITMQVARNLFLWPGGGYPRKAVEAALALTIDALWPKRRIIEVYLNIAEWGDGVFGAEAAARHHFGKPAAQLSAHEAALLAATLPSPRKWHAGRPGPYVQGRAQTIQGRSGQLGPLLACVG